MSADAAIGRALMARPNLLLLDEPSMGLAPMVIRQIFEIIAKINADGTTDPARRAERAAGAEPVHPRLHSGDRVHHQGRTGQRCCTTTRFREAYLGVA